MNKKSILRSYEYHNSIESQTISLVINYFYNDCVSFNTLNIWFIKESTFFSISNRIDHMCNKFNSSKTRPRYFSLSLSTPQYDNRFWLLCVFSRLLLFLFINFLLPLHLSVPNFLHCFQSSAIFGDTLYKDSRDNER